MQILMLHNYYRIRGGEDISAEAEARLLRDAGHTVDFVAMHNHNITRYSSCFTALKSIWSYDAYQRVSDMLRTQSYDIVHVQNFFPKWSPSVHYAARKAHVPSVQTLHNYRLMCLNGLFFTHGNSCQKCTRSKLFTPGILRNCYRSSLPGSLSVACMLLTHRILHTWKRKVSAYICLSKFAREQFVASGIPAERIHIKPHFVKPTAPIISPEKRTGFVYAGRLSDEKGLIVLLEAWSKEGVMNEPLWLAGDGPLRKIAENLAESNPSIRVLGQLPENDVHRLISRSRALLYPTQCFETFGRTVVEAFAHGTPVIASDYGAVAELVKDGKTGMLIAAGDTDAWSHAIRRFSTLSKEEAVRISNNALRYFHENFTESVNLKVLLGIYERAFSTSF